MQLLSIIFSANSIAMSIRKGTRINHLLTTEISRCPIERTIAVSRARQPIN